MNLTNSDYWDRRLYSGSMPVDQDTTLGHILHHIYLARHYNRLDEMGYPYSYIANVLKDYCHRHNVTPTMHDDEGKLVTVVTNEDEDLRDVGRSSGDWDYRWKIIFGYLIWDAFITYTYAAARETGTERAEQLASHAVTLVNNKMDLETALERERQKARTL